MGKINAASCVSEATGHARHRNPAAIGRRHEPGADRDALVIACKAVANSRIRIKGKLGVILCAF